MQMIKILKKKKKIDLSSVLTIAHIFRVPVVKPQQHPKKKKTPNIKSKKIINGN